jgi:hypothetical protein
MADDHVAVASRIGPGTGSSRDSWQHSIGLDLEANGFRAKPRILELRRR